MEDMLKLSAVTLAICLIINLIGQGSRPMSFIVVLSVGVLILSYGIGRAVYIAERVRLILLSSGISGRLLIPIAKVLGISLCGKVTAELCRDMGSRWAACNIELFAVISSLVCMMPLVEEVLKLVGSL